MPLRLLTGDEDGRSDHNSITRAHAFIGDSDQFECLISTSMGISVLFKIFLEVTHLNSVMEYEVNSYTADTVCDVEVNLLCFLVSLLVQHFVAVNVRLGSSPSSLLKYHIFSFMCFRKIKTG